MNPILIFLFALVCILLFTARFRFHPFLSLVSVSILTGILAGQPLGAVEAVTAGMGRVFSHFAVIITCGSVIGLLLQRTGGMSVIADDIMRFSRNPLLSLNFLGFLFSVPVMCCILAYVIFVPIAKELSSKLHNPSISTATALALGALASFNLVYPSPVILSAAGELSANTDMLIIMGFFIALPTSIAGYLYARRFTGAEATGFSGAGEQIMPEFGKPHRLEAYGPVFFPLLLILSQAGFEHPPSLLAFLGDPNVALLIGVLLSLFSGRGLGAAELRALVEKAVRRGGVVLLDLCGGGALGATLALTGVGQALGQLFMQLNMPHILVPFLVAAAFQTVQGSRVVTMLVAPSLLMPLVPELGLPVEILILAMASGTFVFSHVNDPFFWIFGELAELEPPQVFRAYTLGGALMGGVSFLLVCGAYVFFY
ncbi:GntP family permease [Methanosarcina sp. KYL-1]|uniref:GntP family permease n=1 Tax=Methanosarcina sp. KYL-1 TaxID=2602068 RepID=UPI0021018B23|nr:GntP family permease [Methanosarcina sp. KYL-1]MCQ1535962.1 GntP family permease [Methanosarcina sp. KYL-1]